MDPVAAISLLSFLLFFIYLFLRFIFSRLRPKNFTVAFFHPYCNDGGGGERVLWLMVRTIQQEFPFAHISIYTGRTENVSSSDIIQNVKKHFNITLDREVEFIFLKNRWLVEEETYKRFTLLGQSLGSIPLAFEALFQLNPHVCIDSMGYAFTYFVFNSFGGNPVVSYVHYPTISTDMLSLVAERRPTYNNVEQISKSKLKTYIKLGYYIVFARLYSFMGSLSQLAMVNSSWTLNHINNLWKIPNRTHILFPPCNTTMLQKLPLRPRDTVVISIGQFRPEKDHMLQIEAFNKFLNEYPQWKGKVKLIMIGSSRNKEDAQRVENLKNRLIQLNIQGFVELKVNIPFVELQEWLGKATVGLHTMWNEHFGIGVVEFMAAGVIPLAHNSGGPKLDIVVNYNGQLTGFLAASVEDYAKQLAHIFSMSEDQQFAIQKNARASATRFSDEQFASDFKKYIQPVLTKEKTKTKQQ